MIHLPTKFIVICMTDSETIARLEKKTGLSITWHQDCSFYADSNGTILENGVLLYLTDITFHVHADGFDDSFMAMDVLYTDPVLKTDALDFVTGKASRVKRANPFKALTNETLLSVELDGKRFMFFKMKGSQFRQLLSIAQAKQKYSKTVSDRN